VSSSLWTLLAARAAVGVGEASYATLAPTIIDDVSPPDKKGKMLAFFFLAVPVGSALGYILGGFIQQHWGWRTAFFVAGGPGIALALLCLAIDEPVRKHLADAKAKLSETAGTLSRIPLYRRAVLGYCAHTAAIGAFAFWAPKFLSDRFAADLIQKGDQWSISAPSLALWLNGKRYSLENVRIWAHLDAETGLPAEAGEFSATLICDSVSSFFPPFQHQGCYCEGSGDISITGSVTLSSVACQLAPPLADTRVQIVAGADRIMAIMPEEFIDDGYAPSILLLTKKGKIMQYDLSALTVEKDDTGQCYVSLPYVLTSEKVRALLILNTYPAAEQLIEPPPEEE
jgi:MFS family permease